MKSNTSTWAHTVNQIYVHTNMNNPYMAIVEVERRWHDINGNYQYKKHEYKIQWFNLGLILLTRWAGEQIFGAPRGHIEIRQNAYLGSAHSAVFCNIQRLQRKDSKHHRFTY